MSADLVAQLRAWVADEVGDPAAVIGEVRRTSSGFSRENWIFDATWTAGGQLHHRPLIARRDPPGSVLNTDRRVETAVLRALETTSVPSPRLLWADLQGARLGRPCIVMELAPGYCDGFILSGSWPQERRVQMAHMLYDEMAAIHRLDWKVLGLGDVLDDPGPQAAAVAVDHWEAELRRVQLDPEPELAWILSWLRQNAPHSEVTTLVHGDFKAGNVLVSEHSDAVTAVLDWETAHLGDPREDLGWVTNPLRAREHQIPGSWEPGDLLERWSARTGFDADPEAVHWWSVLANFKLSVIVLSGSRAFVDGRLDRLHQSPVGIYELMLNMIGA